MMEFLFFIFMMMLMINVSSWHVILCCLMVFFGYFFMFCDYGDFYCNISYVFGVDLMSFSLIFLTLWISFLMILSSIFVFKFNVYSSEFLYVNLFLLLCLFMSFCVMGFFKYYLFFECSLIPTLILIFGWGYQPERLNAGFYLLFYTLFFSFPMLVGIFYLNKLMGTLSYFLLVGDFNMYLYFSMIMAFLVKMPLVFIHYWLPMAHVEAPVSGSMVLAGVLLKLGGYGLIRVFSCMCNYTLNFIFIGLSLFGMFLIGILCLFQIDMKSLIAYSSVSHMGLVICGIFCVNIWGVIGSLVLMIGHGLCSSGLFCLANMFYDRSGSRSLIINKGLISFMPNLSMFWFLMLINNMASPPSLNLLGEIMLINGIMSWGSFSCLFLMLSSFLSCVYSVYLYSCLNHGVLYSGFMTGSSVYFTEFYLVFMHWLPLNLLVLKVDFMSLLI
nr:NADH dehydrogenase subunit 4 [Sophianus sp.]